MYFNGILYRLISQASDLNWGKPDDLITTNYICHKIKVDVSMALKDDNMGRYWPSHGRGLTSQYH